MLGLMTACVSQQKLSTKGLSCIPCASVKPIYLPENVDEQLEKDVIDFDIAYDKSCL